MFFSLLDYHVDILLLTRNRHLITWLVCRCTGRSARKVGIRDIGILFSCRREYVRLVILSIIGFVAIRRFRSLLEMVVRNVGGNFSSLSHDRVVH